MIRQDYFMRMIQEMVQVLARVLSLKKEEDYDQALAEIDRALVNLKGRHPGAVEADTLEGLLDLCHREGATGEKLLPLADLMAERGELCERRLRLVEWQRSCVLALGLYLEALRSCIVSMDLVTKVDRLIEVTREAHLPPAVRSRLIGYFEARGMWARAEDVLFEWKRTGDPGALHAGVKFYDRLRAKTDEELARGGLPRGEVEEGRTEFLGEPDASSR